MIKAILFDYDGTLMDTKDVIVNSWQEVFRQLRGKEEEEEVILKTLGEPLLYTISKLFPEEQERAFDIYQTYNLQHYLEEIRLFPGVKETLEQLKAKGVALAVVTARLRRTTILGLEKTGLQDLFDVVIAEGDCAESKPHPALAQLALERLGVDKEEALVVGDTVLDLTLGSNSQVRTCLVGWSPNVDVNTLPPALVPYRVLSNMEELVAMAQEENQ